jgi:hypothetical protein
MTENQVKKKIYQQDPVAKLTGIDKHGVHYLAYVDHDSGENNFIVTFLIPLDSKEYGDTMFSATMRAKFLLRWISAWD